MHRPEAMRTGEERVKVVNLWGQWLLLAMGANDWTVTGTHCSAAELSCSCPGSADRKKSDAHKKFHDRKIFHSVFSAVASLYRAKDPGSLILGSIIQLCRVKAAASDRAAPDRNVVGPFAIILSTAGGKQKADRSTAG